MKFAHKQTGIKGGTQIVTVTEHNGKGLVKTTVIPTEMSKQLNVSFKWLVQQVEKSHEQALAEAVTK
uniref:Phage protein n=1 Tax=Enterobacter phage vB_EclP_26 TaxID=3161160 RepID=A0AAU7VFP5_9CAUD